MAANATISLILCLKQDYHFSSSSYSRLHIDHNFPNYVPFGNRSSSSSLVLDSQDYVFDCLVSAFKIVLEKNRVVDLHEDDRGSTNESSEEQNPVGKELASE